MLKKLLASVFCIGSIVSQNSFAQEKNKGEVHGNVDMTLQQYSEDTLINAVVPAAKAGYNAFGNVIYTNGNFSTGMRFESYLNVLNGYPDRFSGTGIGYRFARYRGEEIDVTFGNFYEQFGSGLLLRAYEERTIGVDNVLDGFRVKFNPYRGVYLKGIYGKQRLSFVDGLVNGPGIVRGVDAEVNLNELTDSLGKMKTKIILGGSFVSKFQPGTIQEVNGVDLIMPQNVGSWAGRAKISHGNYSFMGEYAYKMNDPSADNNFIYKSGQAVLLNATYSIKGLGISLDAKHIDNMSFRSDRNALLTDVQINYLPALTKPHSYNLAATLYPYGTQPTGEVAFQGEISYKLKKKTKLGGKYGTTITVNHARAYGLDSITIADTETSRWGYDASIFGADWDHLYFSDFNVQVKRKINKKLKAMYTFLNIIYDNHIIQGAFNSDGSKVKGKINADIHVLELSYKLKKKHNIRTELQYLTTKSGERHQGDWATAIVEYTYSPHWSIGVMDQYNIGNPDDLYKIHYYYFTVGYTKKSSRIALGYGKQREGLFCVGGICRTVPASNGLTLTLTSSF